ncbi:uncharacterized protein DEA37_0009247 [Paragonimus westermani]|uniref:Uncharacterized protein n=1 Tax=Paragonimus westermani TaxID=34504 RepID=A0A5J4N6E9_9TREM|nr:uncharacterized protein DEA37_0013978 [Paragonimus westermani]KAA3676206.1 uncharacterized protein DEA37_0003223 [Paragonimus westermani]KAA3681029.1 uncharacterized protein DEA37_0009247 [Paragonimus westermani]
MNTNSPKHIVAHHFIHLIMLFALMLSCNSSTNSAYRLAAPDSVYDEEGAYQSTSPYWIGKRNFLVDGRLGKRFEHRNEAELEKRSYLVHGRLG